MGEQEKDPLASLSPGPRKCCTRCAYFTAVLLLYFALFNLTKLPFAGDTDAIMTNVTYNATYCGAHPADPMCFGPEMQSNLRVGVNYRSSKLVASGSLFMMPHISMAVILECLFAVILLKGFSHAHKVSRPSPLLAAGGCAWLAATAVV